MDQELAAAIEAQAERAKQALPGSTDSLALATSLAQRFDSQPVEEIQRLIHDTWRRHGLFWRS